VIHWEIDIQGKVQGVFFRASAMQVARQLGLKGYAMNCEDGTVHISVEGPEDQLNEFLQWCHHGPTSAVVTAVDHKISEPIGYKEFLIKR
jgi:acylphosphatase